MRIVAGHLGIREGRRDALVAASPPAVRAVWAAPGCCGFSVSADPLEADRVCIFEAWDDAEVLTAFRDGGTDAGLAAMIVGASVEEYDVVGCGVAGGGSSAEGTQT